MLFLLLRYPITKSFQGVSRFGYFVGGRDMKWVNGRIHRLLCWAGIIISPHFALLGRKPTLKEAWTGNIPTLKWKGFNF